MQLGGPAQGDETRKTEVGIKETCLLKSQTLWLKLCQKADQVFWCGRGDSSVQDGRLARWSEQLAADTVPSNSTAGGSDDRQCSSSLSNSTCLNVTKTDKGNWSVFEPQTLLVVIPHHRCQQQYHHLLHHRRCYLLLFALMCGFCGVRLFRQKKFNELAESYRDQA
eukprot:40696-Amphidinium_carterae.1